MALPAGQMRSGCLTTGKAVLGSQSFSTWTRIPSGATATAYAKNVAAGFCKSPLRRTKPQLHQPEGGPVLRVAPGPDPNVAGQAECGLNYSHSGCIKLLARLGFEYRKPKSLPRVASAQMQTAFIAFYERLMRELPADEAVYFADAVHPEYQTKPAFGWVKVGSNSAVLSTAGRGRVNIHGAVNLENFDAPFVEPTTVDGVSATQLLTKIEARNADKRIIHVIWDNAAYHKGPDVIWRNLGCAFIPKFSP
jgi:hypothetical protein